MSREVLQGKNIANAAAHITTLEHFIWSSLYLPLPLYPVENWQYRT
jgi:hypothetical protein